MPAPVIAAIIGGVASVGGAYIMKKASDKAVDSQTAAADHALALENEQYNLDRSDDAPYRNTGAWSMTELGRLAGIPPGWTIPDTRPPQTLAQQRATANDAVQAAGHEAFDAHAGFGRGREAGQAAVEAIRSTPEYQTLRDLQQAGAQQQTRSSFVRVQAPDGEIADVDPDEAAFMIRNGARRVN